MQKLKTRTSFLTPTFSLLSKCLLSSFLVFFSITLWASSLDEGVKAYERKDYAEALKYFKEASAQGVALAQTFLGVMYESGEGVPQDYSEAMKWYKLAAAQGDDTAQQNLGSMYQDGKGVTQDYSEAMKWYKLAAVQGNANSQFLLGAMYYKGKGVPQDYVKAHMWFNIAASRGYSDASKARDIMSKHMTSEQIAEAQKLARECTEKKYVGC